MGVSGDEKVAKKRGAVRELVSPKMRKLASGRGAGSERARRGLGAGPIGTATQRFRKD